MHRDHLGKQGGAFDHEHTDLNYMDQHPAGGLAHSRWNGLSEGLCRPTCRPFDAILTFSPSRVTHRPASGTPMYGQQPRPSMTALWAYLVGLIGPWPHVDRTIEVWATVIRLLLAIKGRSRHLQWTRRLLITFNTPVELITRSEPFLRGCMGCAA